MDHQNGGSSKQRRTRGSWTAEQRQQMVAESLEPGASVSEIAQRHGIRAGLLTAWRRRTTVANSASRRSSAAGRFAAVRLSTVADEGVIEIDLASRCVRVRGMVDGAMLREVLAALR